MTVQLGIAVTPYAEHHRQIVEQVLAAERGGLDLVGIQDHPYQRRFLDTFALIADLLARTSRLRFFPDVASLPMRPPAMLAKAAASLDVMSGGRFELGLGAGTFWDAVGGMGGPRRVRGQVGDALEEAIRIVRAALDVGPERRVVRGEGPHYPVPGYPPGPPPAHRVEIWVGAMAPRALELIGRLADGWIPGSGTAQMHRFPELNRRIDDAAMAAGRDPATIRRIVNVSGIIGTGGGTGAGGVGRLPGGVATHPAGEWAEILAGWTAEHRLDAIIVWAPDEGTDQVDRFAQDVAPRVREMLRG